MQQSTSPPQYGRPSYSQRLFAASSSAVPASTAASRPHSRSEFNDHVVAVHGCPQPSSAPPPPPPHPLRSAQEVALHLPAQRWVAVEQPVQECSVPHPGKRRTAGGPL